MASDFQRHDYPIPPPALDEGYWSALLNDDEYGRVRPSENQHHAVNNILHDRASLDSTDGDDDWHEIQRICDADEVLELPVVGHNRGGLLVEWRSLRGFVPASQLLDTALQPVGQTPGQATNGYSSSAAFYSDPGHGLNRHRSLVTMVGQKLRLRVIELNQEKNRLILSERAARALPGERAQILQTVQPGQVVSGFITNLCDFGAFVDLGGLEGLIHISELSWGRVAHPDALLRRGQEVQAYVLEVDRANSRIALSLKRMYPDPWQTVEERYRVGEIVEGIVTNVVDFGAFACIEEGLEGLIHVSELAEGHFLHPRNVVEEGQRVRARILTIDGRGRRLGLSLRLNPTE